MRHALDVSRSGRTRNEFDELFDRVLRNPFSFLDDTRPARASETWFQPAFEVEETEQAYLLSVDLPGLKREDVKVDVSENVLTVAGERKREAEGGRSYRRFQRSFTLPSTVDVGQVEANLEDGVLRIALPKSERVKPRSIEIQSGQGGFFSRLVGKAKGPESSGSTETH